MIMRKEKEFSDSVVITVLDAMAEVRTSCGLEYQATGFSAVDNGAFLINKDFSVKLCEDGFSQTFNRYSLGYISDSALRGYIVFTEDGKTIIASLNSFGTYAVVEKSDSAITEENKNNDTDADTAAGDSAIDMNKILIIILISVIALCLVAIICMYIFVFKAKPASKK